MDGTTMRLVGGVDLWYNQIPYPLGGKTTNWRIIILQRFSHMSESSDPTSGSTAWRIWQQAKASGFEGQKCWWFSHKVISDPSDPMDCSSPGSSVHGIFQQEYWSGLPFPSTGHLLTQGSNSGLLHWRQILYRLSHQERAWDIGSGYIKEHLPAWTSLWLTRQSQNLTPWNFLLAYAGDVCACMLSHFSHVQLFGTLCTVAHQAPLSMRSSRQEYCSGLPCCPPGYLPDPGVKPASLLSPPLAGSLFTWKALMLGFLEPNNNLDRDTDPRVSRQAA